jgi:hypothetical protein
MMPDEIVERYFDVVVVGGGPAGISAAIAAARNGARTLLIESSHMVGGEFVSGLPIDGCITTGGEWAIGGIAKELFDACEERGGYVGEVFNWSVIWAVCIDPDIMKIVLVEQLVKHGVSLLLNSFLEAVLMDEGRIAAVQIANKQGKTLVRARAFIDCTGDGDVAYYAGVPYELGSESGELQPVTLVFHMNNVNVQELLEFVRDSPENIRLGVLLSEHPQECARRLYESGMPKISLKHDGPLMSKAIESGELFSTSMLAFTPISRYEGRLAVNSTRIADVNGLDTKSLSDSMGDLIKQVDAASRFLITYIPGFQHAYLAAIAPKIGVRETRRIVGEKVLTDQDVLEGARFPEGIGKGCHPVDVHKSGRGHVIKGIKDHGVYDIPFGCLVPVGVDNLLIAGRCLSSTRVANSSARVMGTCMVMGQAAGTAAALDLDSNKPFRELPVERLRSVLSQQGVVL